MLYRGRQDVAAFLLKKWKRFFDLLGGRRNSVADVIQSVGSAFLFDQKLRAPVRQFDSSMAAILPASSGHDDIRVATYQRASLAGFSFRLSMDLWYVGTGTA